MNAQRLRKLRSKSLRRAPRRLLVEPLESRRLLIVNPGGLPPLEPVLVADLYSDSESSYPDQYVQFGTSVIFAASNGEYGRELFIRDGGVVRLLKDIFPGTTGSTPEELLVVGDRAYFTANNDSFGGELWSTDGTTEGTVMLKRFMATGEPASWASHAGPSGLARRGDNLIFSASGDGRTNELWMLETATGLITQQTHIGTAELGSFPINYVEHGDDLLFSARRFQSDGQGGTAINQATYRLEAGGDITVVDAFQTEFPVDIQRHGDSFLMSGCADDPCTQRPLFVTDGTAAGVRQLSDVNVVAPDWDYSDSLGLTCFNGDHPDTGSAVWCTDADNGAFAIDSPAGAFGVFPFELTFLREYLYYACFTLESGYELCRTNLTTRTTEQFDVVEGPIGAFPTELIVYADTLLAVMTTTHGKDLWEINHLLPAPVLVYDGESPFDLGPTNLTPVGAGLYLSMTTVATGTEPHRIDVNDFGDAPDSVSSPRYPTLKENNGASHEVVDGFHLGRAVDVESDGKPNNLAEGDDGDDGITGFGEGGDEDGVEFHGDWSPGGAASVLVTATIGDEQGFLEAWVDFNGDGAWTNDERIAGNLSMTHGVNLIEFPIPDDAQTGTTFARFRLHVGLTMGPAGPGGMGEVEDHAVLIGVRSWQNPTNPLDVNGDGGVFPIDALLVINHLNAHPGQHSLPPAPSAPPPYLDTNGNGTAEPLDALLVINFINAKGPGEGETADGMRVNDSMARRIRSSIWNDDAPTWLLRFDDDDPESGELLLDQLAAARYWFPSDILDCSTVQSQRDDIQ